MKRNPLSILIVIGLAAALGACALPARFSNRGVTPLAATPTLLKPTATMVTATPKPALTPSRTAVSVVGQAEAAAAVYFKALEAKDFKGAAALVSDFSLAAFSSTRGEVADALNAQAVKGAVWSGFKVVRSQAFSPSVVLVMVSYSTDAGQKTVEETWPFRLEGSSWMYGWKNLVDFKTLDVGDQSINNVTAKPTRMLRYTDRIEMKMMVQNRSNDVVVFGQANEILATFKFSDKTVTARQVQYVLDPQRSYPDLTLTVDGLYNSYPAAVEIRKWKDYNVPPWYTFLLGE